MALSERGKRVKDCNIAPLSRIVAVGTAKLDGTVTDTNVRREPAKPDPRHRADTAMNLR